MKTSLERVFAPESICPESVCPSGLTCGRAGCDWLAQLLVFLLLAPFPESRSGVKSGGHYPAASWQSQPISLPKKLNKVKHFQFSKVKEHGRNLGTQFVKDCSQRTCRPVRALAFIIPAGGCVCIQISDASPVTFGLSHSDNQSNQLILAIAVTVTVLVSESQSHIYHFIMSST